MAVTPHEGRNLKRIREIMGVKQDALAAILGNDWNQQKISLLEQKEVIDSKLLDEVAAALHVKPEAIRNFDEEKAIYNIQHNHDNASNNSNYSQDCTFNPLDKVIELYERMLKEKSTLIEQLENSLKEHRRKSS